MSQTDLAELERALWAAADELRANSTLTAAQYRDPVLGLIFLAFAEHRFDAVRPDVEAKSTQRRPASADDYRALGVVFVPENARLSWLVDRAEWEDIGRNVDVAMDAVEAINTDLLGFGRGATRGRRRNERGRACGLRSAHEARAGADR